MCSDRRLRFELRLVFGLGFFLRRCQVAGFDLLPIDLALRRFGFIQLHRCSARCMGKVLESR